MSKYNESVIIPYLQKKYQELSNQNMVLEVNLLMERQKNAELESKLAEYTSVDKPKEDKKKKKTTEEVLDASTY
jgi:hypothetical protein